ncbi:MAG: hypothetical protein GY708_23045, partial [Actinomycetia bacterium]|nr:hypothetical protein [Actinomycetes bacterium]
VGAFRDDSGSGAAYIFERNQGGVDNWGQLTKLIPTGAGGIGSRFGASVSISGGTLAVGAHLDDSETGAAYLFGRTICGTLEVVKDVDPDDAATNWEIEVDGRTPFTDTLTGDDSTGVTEVISGSYTITETAGLDTVLADYNTTYACTVDGAAGPAGSGTTIADINVGYEVAVACTFTNTRKTGVLTVTKMLDPTDDPGRFDLTIEGVGTGSDIGHGESYTTTVNTGAYTVTETADAGTTLGDYDTIYACSDGKIGSGTVITDVNVIELGTTCTFTNTRVHDITFNKTVDGGDPNQWTFDVYDSGNTLVADDVANGGTATLPDDSYTVVETGPTGYGVSAASGLCALSGGEIALTVDGADGDCNLTNASIQINITESHLVTSVDEGFGKACYWITSNTYPYSGTITIDVGPAEQGLVDLNKSQVTLDASNWMSQTTSNRSNFVCVTAPEDDVDRSGAPICKAHNSDMLGDGSTDGEECGDYDDQIPHAVNSATAPGYGGSTPFFVKSGPTSAVSTHKVQALITDNDTAGVIFSESYAVSDVDEDGDPVARACYWVTLDSEPLGDVVIHIAPDDVEVRTNKAAVTLDAANWNVIDTTGGYTENRVCVLPIDEAKVDPPAGPPAPDPLCFTGSSAKLGQPGSGVEVCGSHLGLVEHTVTSAADAKYDAIDSDPANFSGNGFDPDSDRRTVNVIVRDDDVAQLRLNPAVLNLLEGTARSYDAWLTAQP